MRLVAIPAVAILLGGSVIFRHLLLALFIIAISFSCSTAPPTDVSQRLQQLETKVRELEVSTNVDSDLLRSVRRRQAKIDEVATFDPTDNSGFQSVESDDGAVFLAKLETVTPYLDGYRVLLRLGNPSSITYKGVTLKARWGPRMTKENGAKWISLLKSREVSLNDELAPGAWNPVSFVVSPAAAAEFTYLEIGVVTDVVSLNIRPSR